MPNIGTIASSSREVPDAPIIGTATDVGTNRPFNNGAADVTFTAPSYDGGLPVTSYTAVSSPGGFTGTGSSSPVRVTGMLSNTNYTFKVYATNGAGNSADSSFTASAITITTVPSAPTTIGTLTNPGTSGRLDLNTWGTSANNGGKAITSYGARLYPGSLTSTPASLGSPGAVYWTSLTNGNTYYAEGFSNNANGESAHSPASNSVAPTAPAPPPPPPPPPPVVTPVITSFTFTPGSNGGTLSWTGSNLDVWRFIGDSSTYPAPYNYGTFTATWPGNLVNMANGVNYSMQMEFRSNSGGSVFSSVINYTFVASPPPPPPTPPPPTPPPPTPPPPTPPPPTPPPPTPPPPPPPPFTGTTYGPCVPYASCGPNGEREEYYWVNGVIVDASFVCCP